MSIHKTCTYMCEYVTACYVHTGAVCGKMKWLAEIGAVSVGMCVLGEGGGGGEM